MSHTLDLESIVFCLESLAAIEIDPNDGETGVVELSLYDNEGVKHSTNFEVSWLAGQSLEAIKQLESERDTYRDLCGELLRSLKTVNGRASSMAARCGYFSSEVPEILQASVAISRAEAVMGENSNENDK